ncbi:MAG: hypothetical protein QG635_137, partial [Bacteroidota bacterium]|nr:hypothetical protein [Bacteroidota bacterium]
SRAIQINDPCIITWNSVSECKSEKRLVNIGIVNPSLNYSFEYVLPQSFVYILSVDKMSNQFINLPIGIKKDAKVTITSKNADFDVTDIVSSNNLYSVSPKSFHLNNGESRDVTISITPPDSNYSFSRFQIKTDKCETYFYASNFYTGKPIKDPSLKITFPNGGEVFTVGSDTIITWEGALPDDTVALDYSVDNGATWNNITKSAVNLVYDWKNVPDKPSNNCLMRVKRQIGLSNQVINAHNKDVNCVTFSPDGSTIVSGSNDSTIKFWEISTGINYKTLTDHKEGIFKVEYSRDGKYFASGAWDNSVILWDALNLTKIKTITGSPSFIMCFALNFDGSRLDCGYMDYSIKVFNTQTGAVLKTLNGHSDYVSALTFSPDGNYLASGSADNDVRVWDINSGICLETFKGHTSPVSCVAFHPNNIYVASGASDNLIKMWDKDTGGLVNTYTGHTQGVNSVEFSPDGTNLVSGGNDMIVRIWDIYSASVIKTFTGHSDAINGAAYSIGGSAIVSGSSDKTVRIWGNSITLQSDESDNLWSIVKPKLASVDIDMGKVLVGTYLDSTIHSFLVNSGTYPCNIKSVKITGTNAADFIIISNSPPYSLNPGESKNIEIQFQPLAVGKRNAMIEIQSQDSLLIQNITGEGVQIKLQILSDLVDFGKINVGSTRDSLVYPVKNISTVPVTITNTKMLGPDNAQFSILSGGGSFTLAPNETRELKLSFAPVQKGRTSGCIGFEFGDIGSPSLVLLFGEGIQTKSPCANPDFNFTSFANSGDTITKVGEAKVMGNNIRLTNTKQNTYGAVWTKIPFPVKSGFLTEFSFNMSEGFNDFNDGSIPGADGVAFVIQNYISNAVGGNGGGIGYSGIPNSLAIEFDTYNNDFELHDVNGNHAAIFSNGETANSSDHNTTAQIAINNSIIPLIPDGRTYYCKIEYTEIPNVLTVFIDTVKTFGEPVLKVENLNLGKLLKLKNGCEAYMGITSATGNSYENHDLLSWRICNPECEGIIGIAEEKENESEITNYPNPFSDWTKIEFKTNSGSYVKVEVFDVLGMKCATLADSYYPAGNWELQFDGRNHSAGVYIYIITIDKKTQTGKIVLTK